MQGVTPEWKKNHFIDKTVLQSRTLQQWSKWNWGHPLKREKKIPFPLSCTHMKDFQTYPQGRVWQHSLVPVIDQMLYQAEHGWWSFGDSSLALLVHVLSLAPCLLLSNPLGQHQDQVLVHFPGIEFMKNPGYSKMQQIYTYLVWHSLAGHKQCIKVRKLIWSKKVHRSVAEHFEKCFQWFIGNHSLADTEILQKEEGVKTDPSLLERGCGGLKGGHF